MRVQERGRPRSVSSLHFRFCALLSGLDRQEKHSLARVEATLINAKLGEYPKFAAVIVLWLGIVALALGTALSLMSAHTAAVGSRERRTPAKIVSLGPQERGRQGYHYIFAVGGHLFTGTAFGSETLPYKVGERVTIYYELNDPNVNSVKSFYGGASQSELPFVLGSCFAGAALVYGVRLWSRAPAASRPPS